MYEWMDGGLMDSVDIMDGRQYGYVVAWMDGWMDGFRDGWIECCRDVDK